MSYVQTANESRQRESFERRTQQKSLHFDFQTQAAGPETRSPGAAAAAAAPWQLPQSTPTGVVATESLSCLCILGHRLRFNVGIAVSHGVASDTVPPVTGTAAQ